MANRRAPVEGAEAIPRRRSLATDDSQHSYDGQSQTNGAGHSRRRSSRTNSTSKDSPRSTSPSNADADIGGGKKGRASRNALKKLPRRDSVHVDLEAAGGEQELDEEQDTLGFVPKLSQIQEGKANRPSRSRASSAVVPSTEPQTLRRRHTEEISSSGPKIRHKHASDNLIDQATSSSTSVLSRSTQQSNVSVESHSTVTPKSNDSQALVSKFEPPVEKKPLKSALKLKGTAATRTAEAPSNALKLSHEDIIIEHLGSEDHHSISTSSAVPSSSSLSDEEQHDHELSSSAEESEHVTESPPTSPTSKRKSKPSRLRHHGHDFPKIKVPLYASNFVHGPEDEEQGESHDGLDEPIKEEDENEEHGEESSNEEHYRLKVKSSAKRSILRRKAPSLSAPSTTSSGNTDPHTRRLRQQERDLANHVRSPRPQKEYQFSPSSSSNGYPPPPMPPYGPEEPSYASPSGFYDRHQTQEWPPMPPLPAPLPIGYMPMSPEAAHASPVTMRPPPENAVQQHPPPFPPYPAPPLHCQPYIPPPDMTKTTMVGYELLADKLSESPKDLKVQKDGMVPMYRKFEHLNHRVLLHLQDEICELEEELRYLDECIAQSSPRDEAGENYPASRRNDARYGHELHYKRTELLGRIFQKLGQYNQALFSFNNLLKDLDPASPEATSAYRAWIEKREPIDYVETRFLERKDDLLAVSRKQSAHNHNQNHNPNQGGGQQPPDVAVIWLSLALMLPLMAFAMIPNVMGRLVVMVLIGSAELKVVTSTPELMRFMTSREWIVAGSV